MLFSNDDKWFLYHFFKGRGRQESEGTDDVEDYRARQPSEPALWDFLSTKFPTVKGLDFHMYYLLIINCYLMLTQLMSVKIVKKDQISCQTYKTMKQLEYLTIYVIICFIMWSLLMWIAHPYPKWTHCETNPFISLLKWYLPGWITTNYLTT